VKILWHVSANGTSKAGKSDERIPEAISPDGHDGKILSVLYVEILWMPV